METTIISQFKTKGLTFKNGRHHYYGNLVIEGDGAIWDNIVVHGDLVVAGNLTSHGKIIVVGRIQVGGNFTAARNVIAGSVTAKTFGCYANVRIKSDLEVGSYFWVDGNLMAKTVKTNDTSSVHGWLKASSVHGDVICDGELINKKN